MKLKFKILYVVIFSQLIIPNVLPALETAPDITDREVVEKLAKLEAGQQALNHRISDLRSEMKSGQKALRSEMKSGQESLRSEMKSGQESLRSEMKSGQEALRSEMKSGQEALRSEMKSGYDALAKRLDDSNNTMLVLFGSLITLIVALFGYIAWDRRTMMKPILEKIERVEQDVAHSLDLSNTDA